MDPWIVEISRGQRVESSSLGHGVVVNADGETILSFGDLKRETFRDLRLNGFKRLNWF